MRDWYFKQFVPLARAPLQLPPGYVSIRLVVRKGRILLLCPVDKANKLPKSLKADVQFEMPCCEEPVGREGIIGPDGRIYAISTAESPRIHTVVHKATCPPLDGVKRKRSIAKKLDTD